MTQADKEITPQGFPLGGTEELLLSGDVPALLCNRHFVVADRSFLRIAFGEMFVEGAAPKYRVAIGLPSHEAVALVRSLVEMLGKQNAVPEGFAVSFKNDTVEVHVPQGE